MCIMTNVKLYAKQQKQQQLQINLFKKKTKNNTNSKLITTLLHK